MTVFGDRREKLHLDYAYNDCEFRRIYRGRFPHVFFHIYLWRPNVTIEGATPWAWRLGVQRDEKYLRTYALGPFRFVRYFDRIPF